jgi:molybdate transport system substrate-binding protein
MRSARSTKPAVRVVNRRLWRRGGVPATALFWLWSLAGVATATPGSTGVLGPAVAPRPAELVVFEAASLKDVFSKLSRRFEDEHPGTRVIANSAGSQELRAQLEQGASADVFAAADRRPMDALVAAGLVNAPSVFACNEPVLVVRAGLAAVVKTFADLPHVERLVVGAPNVPIGAYTSEILKKAASQYGADFVARVNGRVVSRELNVRQVLAKVVLGEADAGIVYRSDAISAPPGKLQLVPIPAALNVTAQYPMAVLKQAPQPVLARQWLALVTSPAGAAALREAGFVACSNP